MDFYLDEAPCGFLAFAENGAILTVNRTLAHWLERSPEELTGKRFDSLLPIAGRIFLQTHFFPMLTLRGEASEIFMNLRSQSGRDLPMLVNAKRKEVDGAVENYCVFMPVPHRQQYESELLRAREAAEESVTRNAQLQRATEALEQSKQELDLRLTQLAHRNEELLQVSKVISHDMQEPARKVAMFADIIRRDEAASDSKNIQLATDRITASARRMRSLIGCLEQYVAIDVDPEPVTDVSLQEVVESARLRVSALQEGIPIAVTVGALPAVRGRRGQLELLFYHLLLNAVQFRREDQKGPQIHISGETVQHNRYRSLKDKYQYVDQARIVVKDEGSGFPQPYAEYIFQLFRKAHPETAGDGFGLSLCKKIAESHQGSISARSEPGEGASFVLLLPTA